MNSRTKIGFIFPGQGAQAVGMGFDLYHGSPAAKSVFDTVDAALGRSLTGLIFNGPDQELRDTKNAQLAVMAVSLAAVKAMEEQLGPDEVPSPSLLAGHSLGEFTALAVSGVLDLEDVIKLVQIRARLMQDACEKSPGSMAAILGLDLDTIEEISRETGTYVSNINTKEQIVISGSVIAVAQALDLASPRGAKRTVPLKVGGAFHSDLMEPAKGGLIEAVDSIKFNEPKIPIIGNCIARPLDTADQVKQEVISQISSCVHWKGSIDYMIDQGISFFVEFGPGKTLSSMVKRIDSSASSVNIGDMETVLSFSKK